MSLDGIITAFAKQLHSIATFFASFYALCVFVAILGQGNSGFHNMATILDVFGLRVAKSWVISFYNRLIMWEVASSVRVLCLIWLLVALTIFVYLFWGERSGQLMPAPAVGVTFTWSLYTDLYSCSQLWNIATFMYMLALVLILVGSLKRGREFWKYPLFAIMGCLVTPMYALVVIPFWISTKTDDYDQTRGLSEIVRQLDKIQKKLK